MSKNLGLALVAAVMFTGSVAGPASAGPNLIANPGFETGDISGWTQVGNYATGYNNAAGGNFVGMTPYAGNYFFEFGNLTPQGSAGISQTVTTVAGQTYALSFEWSTGGADAPSAQSYQVLWDNNVVDSFSTAGTTSWALASNDLVGTGSDTLTIEGFRNFGYNGVDNVSLTGSAASVPEPITLSLFGTGLAGAIAMRRRKKNVA